MLDEIVVYNKMFDSHIPVPTDIYEKACMKNDKLELHEHIQEHFKKYHTYKFDSVLIHLDKRTIINETLSLCKVTYVVDKKKFAEDKFYQQEHMQENIESIKVSALQKKLKPAVPMLINVKENASLK